MFCVITTQIFSQFLSWEPVPKCFQSFPSLLVVACMKQVQASAPKHVEQFQQEGHLRWDSLGEFLALAVSLEEIGVKANNDKVKALAAALNAANEQFLDANKNPSRKVKEIDNRGSHFYLALYWAQNLAACGNDELKAQFGPIAAGLTENEGKIAQELIDCQGSPVDIGGYFKPVDDLAFKAMRPSESFNVIIDGMA